MENIRLFTSESVTEGHPDKVCDRIADAVLDAYISQDKNSRVALEVCCKGEHLYMLGEITGMGSVDLPAVARRVIKDIGYNSAELGFDAEGVKIECNIEKQSPDIAMGVDSSFEEKEGDMDKYGKTGAGDQGMMFGYACTETPELMPLAIALAHKLTRRLTYVRKSGILPYLRPDGKAQVTVRYIGGVPAGIDAVVVSTQHSPDVKMEDLRVDIKNEVIDAVIPAEMMDESTKLFINPTGRFVLGGPAGDSGVTGRKIIVDTYGGYCPHGEERVLYGAIHMQKRSGGGAGGALSDAGGLCHRRGKSGERNHRHFRHGKGERRSACARGAGGVRSASRGDNRQVGFAQSHI